MQNILLKGTEIHDMQTIKEALEKVGIQPHNIQTFETGYMRQNNIQSNIWQITLQPKTDTNTILNIRYIAEWSVKWELMKKPLITQCRRCERFNHSASNCTYIKLQMRQMHRNARARQVRCGQNQQQNKTNMRKLQRRTHSQQCSTMPRIQTTNRDKRREKAYGCITVLQQGSYEKSSTVKEITKRRLP